MKTALERSNLLTTTSAAAACSIAATYGTLTGLQHISIEAIKGLASLEMSLMLLPPAIIAASLALSLQKISTKTLDLLDYLVKCYIALGTVSVITPILTTTPLKHIVPPAMISITSTVYLSLLITIIKEKNHYSHRVPIAILHILLVVIAFYCSAAVLPDLFKQITPHQTGCNCDEKSMPITVRGLPSFATLIVSILAIATIKGHGTAKQ